MTLFKLTDFISSRRSSHIVNNTLSEELIDAAKGGDVGVVRAILDRGNVNINGGDRVTIFFI
jgi:hypothetical protein